MDLSKPKPGGSKGTAGGGPAAGGAPATATPTPPSPPPPVRHSKPGDIHIVSTERNQDSCNLISLFFV